MLKIFLVLCLTAVGYCNVEKRETRYMNIISQSTSYFASDVFQLLKTREVDSGNFVFSPLSLSILLASLNAGSGGITAKEITAALRLTGLSNADILAGYKNLVTSLNVQQNFLLKSANTVYIDSKFTVKQSYIDVLKTYFHSVPQRVEFKNIGAAAENINRWVSRETNNKIKRLVGPIDISTDTKMMLLNANYFNAEFETPFDSMRTDKQLFHTLKNQSVLMDFMHYDGELPFGVINGLDAEAVAVPYKKNAASLVILLPKNPAEFSKFEEKLRGFDLTSVVSSLDLARLELTIPKLTLESEIDLLNENVLKKLGIKSLYEDGNNSDFSGISDAQEELSVGSVKQKAQITVTEMGTEASAASFASLVNKIIHKPFVINRPFVGFIYDSNTKSVLYIVRKVA